MRKLRKSIVDNYELNFMDCHIYYPDLPEESDPYIFGIYQDHVIVDGPPYEEWEKYDEPDLF